MPAEPAAPQRRIDVPHNAPEKVQLCAFLDWYRDTPSGRSVACPRSS